MCSSDLSVLYVNLHNSHLSEFDEVSQCSKHVACIKPTEPVHLHGASNFSLVSPG